MVQLTARRALTIPAPKNVVSLAPPVHWRESSAGQSVGHGVGVALRCDCRGNCAGRPLRVLLTDERGDAGRVRRRHRRAADPHPATAVCTFDGRGRPPERASHVPLASVLDQPARMRPYVVPGVCAASPPGAATLTGVTGVRVARQRGDARSGDGDHSGQLGRGDLALVTNIASHGCVRRPVGAQLVGDRDDSRSVSSLPADATTTTPRCCAYLVADESVWKMVRCSASFLQ